LKNKQKTKVFKLFKENKTEMAEVRVKVKPPDVSTRKLLDRVRVAKPFYIYFVQNPRASPTEEAVKMRSTLEAKMRTKATWDKWEMRRKAVGDIGWQAGALGKGADRLVPGVEHGIGYYFDFARQFFPYLAEGRAKVKKLARITLEDSIRRAATMIRHNAAFRFVKKGKSKEDLEAQRTAIEGIALPA